MTQIIKVNDRHIVSSEIEYVSAIKKYVWPKCDYKESYAYYGFEVGLKSGRTLNINSPEKYHFQVHDDLNTDAVEGYTSLEESSRELIERWKKSILDCMENDIMQERPNYTNLPFPVDEVNF